MTCLIATLTAAFMALAGLGIGANRLSKQESLDQKEQLLEATEFWRDKLNDFRESNGDRALSRYSCESVCDQLALLSGHENTVAVCGQKTTSFPFEYEKCVKQSLATETKSTAIERIDAEFDSVISALAEKNYINPESYGEAYWTKAIADELKLRARNQGWDLTHCIDMFTQVDHNRRGWLGFRDMASELGETLRKLLRTCDGHNSWDSVRDCEWLTHNRKSDLSYGHGFTFCEANKDFPDCKQFLDIYGKCEKILADAANKNEL